MRFEFYGSILVGLLVLAACGGPVPESAEEGVAEPSDSASSVEPSDNETITNRAAEESVPSLEEVSGLLEPEVVEDDTELQVQKAEKQDQLSQEENIIAEEAPKVAIEDVVEAEATVAEESDVEEPEEAIDEDEKDSRERPALACPAFSLTKSKKLNQWLKHLESLTLPDLGTHPITATLDRKEKRRHDYIEHFQKVYTLVLPKSIDVTEGYSGAKWITFFMKDGQRSAVSCLYRGRGTPDAENKCASNGSAYDFWFCLNTENYKKCKSDPEKCVKKHALENPYCPGKKVKATSIRLRVNHGHRACETTKVEMKLKLTKASSPTIPGCGDVITRSVNLKEDLNCSKSTPVALTLMGDGIKLNGRGKVIQVGNERKSGILVVGSKNKIKNVILKGTRPGLGVVAYEDVPTNDCQKIKEVISQKSSLGFPESLISYVLSAWNALTEWFFLGE